MEKKYCIGDSIYVQKPIVLGQLKRLLSVLDGISLSGVTPLATLQSVGEKLPSALAILLMADGVGVREAMEGVEERADRIEWHASPEVCLEVVEDFFAFNPVSSVSERLGAMLEKFAAQAVMNTETSKPSCSSSAGATCPKETGSSGESRHGSPSSGSGFTIEKGETESNRT